MAGYREGYAKAYADMSSDPTKLIYSNEDIEKLVKHAIHFTLECTTGWGQSAIAKMVPGLYKKWLKPEN
jgi:hypothetical protein